MIQLLGFTREDENAWFSAEEGARPPDRNDWTIFKEDKYEGWWVRVGRRSRCVTDYADRFIITFPPAASARGRRTWKVRRSGSHSRGRKQESGPPGLTVHLGEAKRAARATARREE